jgi:hypothetical protein
MKPELTDENFLMYAIKNYDNPGCSGLPEFYDDVKRLRYVKRLLGRYHSGGELKERLIINHLLVLYNVFGIEAATNMLFFRMPRSLWTYLKTFLVFLNFMPQYVIVSTGMRVPESEIPLDSMIVEKLRKI